MQTFQVTFPLDSGYHLNVLMAAPNEATAKVAADKVLRTACEPRNVGDVMAFCWRFDEITVQPIEVRS